jgi:copper chaperone CopZ
VAPSRGIGSRARRFLRYAYVESIDDIAVRFVVGLLIGGIVAIALPADFFEGRAIGSGLPAMLLMVAVGIPMYVCSTSSIPIAVALIAKGLSPGAAYVFLVAGPATNAATLAILTNVLGRRQTALYVATLIVGSLAFGPIMDAIARATGYVAPMAMMHGAHLETLAWSDFALAGLLLAMILFSIARRAGWKGTSLLAAGPTHGSSTGKGEEMELTVKGMTCSHCAANVESAVRAVEGVTDAKVDLQAGKLYVDGSSELEEVAEAVRNAGYEPA